MSSSLDFVDKRLPPSLQYLMQLHLVIQKREVEISSKAPCLHLVETAPSILRKMPWVVFKDRVSGEVVGVVGVLLM